MHCADLGPVSIVLIDGIPVRSTGISKLIYELYEYHPASHPSVSIVPTLHWPYFCYGVDLNLRRALAYFRQILAHPVATHISNLKPDS